MSLLTPKAMESYADVLDYEAHILIRSLYQDTKQGTVPLNPANYAGRYVLKLVVHIVTAMIAQPCPAIC